MAVRKTLKITEIVNETNPDQGIGQVPSSLSHDVSYTVEQTSGTAASEQDLVWSDRDSVANGAPDTFDLSGGLTSKLDGSAVTFVEVTDLWIRNKSTTTGENLQVGGGSNPWVTWVGASGDIVIVPPGGILKLSSPIDGFGVTAGTGDILQIASSSGTISYDIKIEGRSA